eukprot:11952351-Heterocapsa_arctica.AAC.1
MEISNNVWDVVVALRPRILIMLNMFSGGESSANQSPDLRHMTRNNTHLYLMTGGLASIVKLKVR